MVPIASKITISDYYTIVEGSLEFKLPTIWTDEQQSRAEAERRERSEERRVEEKESEERRCRCAKRWESDGTLRFSQRFVAPESRKVGSLKRRVRSQLARWEMKNCTPLWREAYFEVKMYKTHHSRTTFGSWDVEKVHAVVARSTFWSQNVQNTQASDHFWKLRCRKSARRCGAKHTWKSKCVKQPSVGRLLEVEMSKKCTPLWRKAHFEVKMYKTHQVRTTFGSWDVEKVHAVVARSTFGSQNVKKHWGSDHFWKFRSRKSVRRWGAKHILTSKCTKHKGLGHFWRFRCRFASLHYTTWHYTTLHYTTLHYTTVHNTATTTTQLHNHTPLHYNYNYTTTLHSTTLNYTTLHYTKLRYTTLHYTTLHYLPLHFTTLHYITLHSTTPQLQLQLQLHNYTPLH